MRIITLIENLVYDKNLVAEHGLSMYIENNNIKILFDTGQTKNFINNSVNLGIDLSEIDFVIISHGHYDHTGGLNKFLTLNKKAKVILKPAALIPKYHGNNYIGIPENLNIPKNRLTLIRSDYKITNNIHIFSDINIYYLIDLHYEKFFTKSNNSIEPDHFKDELFICIEHNNEIIIISSCSHNGITNIIENVRRSINLPIKLVLGGFHINHASLEEKEHIIKYLNSNNVKEVGFCHCSGIENYSTFKEECQANVYYNYTGKIIEL